LPLITLMPVSFVATDIRLSYMLCFFFFSLYATTAAPRQRATLPHMLRDGDAYTSALSARYAADAAVVAVY